MASARRPLPPIEKLRRQLNFSVDEHGAGAELALAFRFRSAGDRAIAAIKPIVAPRAAVTPVRLTARGWSFHVASEPEDGKIEIDDLFQATRAAAEARRFEVVEALERRGVAVLHCDDVREAVGYIIDSYVRDVYRRMLDRADCATAH